MRVWLVVRKQPWDFYHRDCEDIVAVYANELSAQTLSDKLNNVENKSHMRMYEFDIEWKEVRHDDDH